MKTTKTVELTPIAVTGARGRSRYGVQAVFPDGEIRIYLICNYPKFDNRLPSTWTSITFDDIPKKYQDTMEHIMNELDMINEAEEWDYLTE